jgi:hypothetical protein
MEAHEIRMVVLKAALVNLFYGDLVIALDKAAALICRPIP